MSLATPASDLALKHSDSARSSVAITPVAASRSSKHDDELPKISEKEKPEANQLKSVRCDSTLPKIKVPCDQKLNKASSSSTKDHFNVSTNAVNCHSFQTEEENAARMAAEHAMKTQKTKKALKENTETNLLEDKRAKNENPQEDHNERKVFTVMGPYPGLRAALKKRGWVERFKSESSGEGNNIVILPRSVILEININAVDVLSNPPKDFQLINHFAKASAFTTKTGLCQNLRNVHWFNDIDPMTFYPRCYNLRDTEEKQLFIENYRLTACICFIKHFVARYNSESVRSRLLASKRQQQHKTCSLALANSKTQPPTISVTDIESLKNRNNSTTPALTIRASSSSLFQSTECNSCDELCKQPQLKIKQISAKALCLALERCKCFLEERCHEDIDKEETETVNELQWNQFIEVFHIFVRNQLDVDPKSWTLLKRCKDVLKAVLRKWPQFNMEGSRNIWVLKPGAKSRGRGIQCSDNLEEIYEAAIASKWAIVIQKYIERPLLIHGTKFDIRQWFLVTDWNPLTMWFYNACYLRFCSKIFSLDDLDPAIHVSNNCIQKNYEPEAKRAKELPEDNMWTHEEFIHYLRRSGHGEVFAEKIIPGMKKAIVSTLLCTQELVVPRKGTFELYGADFMLTNDFHTWLLEINSSPSMARSTKATAALVDCVLEDMIRVVVDQKSNDSGDTGNFELAYRQTLIDDFPPTDASLAVYGKLLLLRNSNDKTAKSS